ncbi:MAG: hypothetical protein WC002_03320 [Candidatus Muiribacteriota bacterium]
MIKKIFIVFFIIMFLYGSVYYYLTQKINKTDVLNYQEISNVLKIQELLKLNINNFNVYNKIQINDIDENLIKESRIKLKKRFFREIPNYYYFYLSTENQHLIERFIQEKQKSLTKISINEMEIYYYFLLYFGREKLIEDFLDEFFSEDDYKEFKKYDFINLYLKQRAYKHLKNKQYEQAEKYFYTYYLNNLHKKLGY